jgi:dihydrofolate reductase
MRKLSVFNSVSLDGYFTDDHGDLSWTHKADPEWTEFVSGNAQGGGALMLGRKTYEMMASFWPTPQAIEFNRAVAEGMNRMEKIVFSRTLQKASWQNTKVLNGDLAAEVAKLKQASGPDMVILGSGSIVAQLTQARLIDTYQVVLNPVVLGRGRTMFDGVRERGSLKLEKSRQFSNGNVVLWYQPAV